MTPSSQSTKGTNKAEDNKIADKKGYASKPQASKLAQPISKPAGKSVDIPGEIKQYVQPSVDKLQTITKASLERITIAQLPKQKPDFTTPGVTKDAMVTEYLTGFIVEGIQNGKLTESHLLPRKQDIAKHLGVSIGTVQNAIRTIEDYGHVESKQRIGTLVRDASTGDVRMRKLTSKRDRAVKAVRQYILEKKFDIGDPLPSAREIADSIGSATNTTRLALEFLTHEGILFSYGTRGNRANWELKQLPDKSDAEDISVESETLIDQIERDLKSLIAANFEVGTKLPSHLDLAATLKVSIKTVHDAMKRLNAQGIVQSKRGRYGTFVQRTPDTAFMTNAESIFVPVDDPIFYNYEKVEGTIKHMIADKFNKGDKLPPMGDLSKALSVSSNTIRKALLRLSEDGLVTFSRGRYGGTFVNRIPSKQELADIPVTLNS